jgi:hypothetical protein
MQIWRFYFLPRLLGVCESALPAAVLDALPVRPSLNTLEAAFAALGLVTLLAMPFSLFLRCYPPNDTKLTAWVLVLTVHLRGSSYHAHFTIFIPMQYTDYYLREYFST